MVGYRGIWRAKEGWLTELLQLPNGIPSHNIFGRVFAHAVRNRLSYFSGRVASLFDGVCHYCYQATALLSNSSQAHLPSSMMLKVFFMVAVLPSVALAPQ